MTVCGQEAHYPCGTYDACSVMVTLPTPAVNREVAQKRKPVPLCLGARLRGASEEDVREI